MIISAKDIKKENIVFQRPLISVIIPVYNMETYLARCLDSVINNSYQNLQIICVNDGSTDNSLNILKEYEGIDSRIVVIDQKNQKLSAARNAGMDIAKGDWISFIDSDDWVHKDFFRILMNIANESKCDLIIGGAKRTSADTENDELIDQAAFREISVQELRQHKMLFTRVWGRLIKSELCQDIRFIPGTEPTEDSVFNAFLYKSNIRIALTDCPLYYYYKRNNSAVHSQTGMELLISAKRILKELDTLDKDDKRELLIRSMKTFLSGRFLKSVNSGYKVIKEDCEEYIRDTNQYFDVLTLQEKSIYFVLMKMPALYSLFRIAEDPTLIDFIIKRKHRNDIAGED